MKTKNLSLVVGMALATNMGVAQMAELDETAEMTKNPCSVTKQENQSSVNINRKKDNMLFIFVEGIGLSTFHYRQFDLTETQVYQTRVPSKLNQDNTYRNNPKAKLLVKRLFAF